MQRSIKTKNGKRLTIFSLAERENKPKAHNLGKVITTKSDAIKIIQELNEKNNNLMSGIKNKKPSTLLTKYLKEYEKAHASRSVVLRRLFNRDKNKSNDFGYKGYSNYVCASLPNNSKYKALVDRSKHSSNSEYGKWNYTVTFNWKYDSSTGNIHMFERINDHNLTSKNSIYKEFKKACIEKIIKENPKLKNARFIVDSEVIDN
jgi:hypothetical protein